MFLWHGLQCTPTVRAAPQAEPMREPSGNHVPLAVRSHRPVRNAEVGLSCVVSKYTYKVTPPSTGPALGFFPLSIFWLWLHGHVAVMCTGDLVASK